MTTPTYNNFIVLHYEMHITNFQIQILLLKRIQKLAIVSLMQSRRKEWKKVSFLQAFDQSLSSPCLEGVAAYY